MNLYSTENSSSIATTVNDEYRWIQVNFYSCWLLESPKDKQDAVIHECVHFFVNPLYHQARRIVAATCGGNEEMKNFAYGELQKTIESVTQDLTYSILNKFNESKGNLQN